MQLDTNNGAQAANPSQAPEPTKYWMQKCALSLPYIGYRGDDGVVRFQYVPELCDDDTDAPPPSAPGDARISLTFRNFDDVWQPDNVASQRHGPTIEPTD